MPWIQRPKRPTITSHFLRRSTHKSGSHSKEASDPCGSVKTKVSDTPVPPDPPEQKHYSTALYGLGGPTTDSSAGASLHPTPCQRSTADEVQAGYRVPQLKYERQQHGYCSLSAEPPDIDAGLQEIAQSKPLLLQETARPELFVTRPSHPTLLRPIYPEASSSPASNRPSHESLRNLDDTTASSSPEDTEKKQSPIASDKQLALVQAENGVLTTTRGQTHFALQQVADQDAVTLQDPHGLRCSTEDDHHLLTAATYQRRLLDLTCREAELLALLADARRLLTARTLSLISEHIKLRQSEASCPRPSWDRAACLPLEDDEVSALRLNRDAPHPDTLKSTRHMDPYIYQMTIAYLRKRLEVKEAAELSLYRDILECKQENEALARTVKMVRKLHEEQPQALQATERQMLYALVERLNDELEGYQRKLHAKETQCAALEEEVRLLRSHMNACTPLQFQACEPAQILKGSSPALGPGDPDESGAQPEPPSNTPQTLPDPSDCGSAAPATTPFRAANREASPRTAGPLCPDGGSEVPRLSEAAQTAVTQPAMVDDRTAPPLPLETSLGPCTVQSVPVTFVYVPDTTDLIDTELAYFCNARRNWIVFTRIKPGYYLFGRLYVYIDQGRHYLRVHLGKQRYSMRKFVHVHEPTEYQALSQIAATFQDAGQPEPLAFTAVPHALGSRPDQSSEEHRGCLTARSQPDCSLRIIAYTEGRCNPLHNDMRSKKPDRDPPRHSNEGNATYAPPHPRLATLVHGAYP